MDTFRCDEQLCLKVNHLQIHKIQKALRYLRSEKPMLFQEPGSGIVFCLRFKSGFARMTKKLKNQYWQTLYGVEPDGFKELDEAGTPYDRFKALAKMCQSMHSIYPPNAHNEDADNVLPSSMNPALLMCTCKGFRGYGECSHVIAATAKFFSSHYDEAHLEQLLEEAGGKKKAAHRPRNTVGANRIQPEGDSSDEEEDDEDGDEDLWECGDCEGEEEEEQEEEDEGEGELEWSDDGSDPYFHGPLADNFSVSGDPLDDLLDQCDDDGLQCHDDGAGVFAHDDGAVQRSPFAWSAARQMVLSDMAVRVCNETDYREATSAQVTDRLRRGVAGFAGLTEWHVMEAMEKGWFDRNRLDAVDGVFHRIAPLHRLTSL